MEPPTINNLPYELLIKIFKHAIWWTKDTTVSDYYFPLTPHDPATLYFISHVCGKWREIVLSDPSLWVDINMAFGRLTLDERIKRAQGSPLTLRSPLYSQQWPTMLSHVDSWRSFSHCTSMGYIGNLTQPSPKLEMFQLHYRPIFSDYDVDRPDRNAGPDKFFLPSNLFGGHAPSLTKFAIANVEITPTFDFSLWHNLTDLYVDFHLGGVYPISSRKWLSILRPMKCLESLFLAWTYKRDLRNASIMNYIMPLRNVPDDAPKVTDDDVHLSRLRTLVLVATVKTDILCNIFSKLVVPNFCSTLVTAFDATNDHDMMRYLEAGIHRRLKGWRIAGTPFYFSLLHGELRFGFKIDLGARTDDIEGCAFVYHSLESNNRMGTSDSVPLEAMDGTLAKLPTIAVKGFPTPWSIKNDSFIRHFNDLV
ncbi:hypothetical protein BDN70DRAFT_886768 [Pholiota conissans]|uniref:F-box domain-containing protein n=1 Tax=Pholiota conissans TaxID=109636 RepID=A0A9P6CT41_9AGAR|nr:hypothetical protein BDN70DRAFT_886768 [Pholiota conissans]